MSFTVYRINRSLIAARCGGSGRLLWGVIGVRKQHACEVCGSLIPKGYRCWRPITNTRWRSTRVCECCVRHASGKRSEGGQ